MIRLIEWRELQLGQRIGAGGNGVVHQATYKSKQVAVKRLPLDRQTDASAVKRFRNEIQLLTSLQHPSLVQSIGICSDVDGCANNYALVTELLPTTLLQHLAALPPTTDADDRLHLLLQVASGLQYLHDRLPAITHSDLKPANVMVDAAGHAKLLDFGIAHVQEMAGVTITQQTNQGVAGSPQYMGPELIRDDDPHYGPFNDVYSFGCMLLFIYTQQLPYPNARRIEQVQAASIRRPPQLSVAAQQAIPEPLQLLFTDCVQAGHMQRPSVGQIVERLSAMLPEAGFDEEEKVASEECCICLIDEPVTDGWTCDSQHFTCKDCAVALLQQSIDTNLLRSSGTIKCAGGGTNGECQAVFTRKHIIALTAATGHIELVDNYTETFERYVAGLLADQQLRDQAFERLQREHEQARELNQQQSSGS